MATAAPALRWHLLWRVITGLDRQLATLARVQPAPDVVTDLRLTAREQAVLGLLAEGHTATGIGRRLMIAERTVHKHLEHVYAKLGVTDRLAAVLRAGTWARCPADYALVRIPCGVARQ